MCVGRRLGGVGRGSSRPHSADFNYISHGLFETGIRRRLPILLETGLCPVHLHATAARLLWRHLRGCTVLEIKILGGVGGGGADEKACPRGV